MQNNVLGFEVKNRTDSVSRHTLCSMILVGVSIFLLDCQRSNINLAALQRPKTMQRLNCQAVRDAGQEEQTYNIGPDILNDLCIL